ncbi:MAG: hypothetical protein E7310_07410 [Clostridiales bacterium]|nr:hypothetical protein [Clostridiales bacterium]
MDYSYYDYGATAPVETIGDEAILFGMGIFIIVMMGFITLVTIFNIVCQWKIFVKAGEKGWKALIPIYNSIVLFKIIGLSPYLLFIYLAGFIPTIGSIAIYGLGIVQNVFLGKAFKKDAGFIVGLVLLPIVFLPMLAFGKSEYQLEK